MGRFDDLLQDLGKEIKLGAETFVIRPLRTKYIGLLAGSDNNPEKQTKNIIQAVLISLQQTDPTITLEDVESLPIARLKEIINVMLEVNELNEQ